MSETQFTPGPWQMIGPDGFGDYTINTASDPLAIAAVCNGAFREMGGLTGQHAANARLIAAAPEMYEALRNALAAGLPDEVAQYARAALAKALGDQ